MSNRNRWGTLARAGLASGAVALAACILPAASSAAARTPTSRTFCKGRVTPDPAGKSSDEPNLLGYRFSCDGSISAYTVLVNQQGDWATGGAIDDFNPSPSVFEGDGLTPSPTESITCEGTTPSDGINCNLGTQGAQLTQEYFAQGSIDLVQAYCKHLPTTSTGKTASPGTPAIPQARVQLVVTDYTGAEDGPFTLWRPTACPKVPNVVPTPQPKAKPKKKSKTRSKSSGTSHAAHAARATPATITITHG